MSRFGESNHYDPNGILFQSIRGNLTIQSMEIQSHLQVEISNGLNSPIGRGC